MQRKRKEEEELQEAMDQLFGGTDLLDEDDDPPTSTDGADLWSDRSDLPTDDAELHDLVNATRFSRGRPAAAGAHGLSSMSSHGAAERQNRNGDTALALVECDRATAVLERTHRTDRGGPVSVMRQGRLAPVTICSTRPAVDQNRRRGSGRWWLAGCLFLASLFIGAGMLAPTAPVPSPQRKPDSSVGTASRGIEAICVGQRVVGKDSDPTGSARTAPSAVDPKTWRKLVLRAEDRWPDGTLDVINVETLQPPAWLADQGGAVPGSMVSLPLDLLEMGLPEDMQAEVIANEPCPSIGAGPGRVVLTTVNHLNPSVVELGVVDGSGRSEKVRPTSLHKFYSESRKEWISAGELEIGEQLCGVDGPLTVTGVERMPGVHRVYNMTVEGEHVYRVSSLGVLAHNNGCGRKDWKPGKPGRKKQGREPSEKKKRDPKRWKPRNPPREPPRHTPSRKT